MSPAPAPPPSTKTVSFETDELSIEIKAPSYGDSSRFNLNTNYIIMMDSSVSSYRKKNSKIKLLNFVNMTRDDTDDFIDFYLDTLGETITYVDPVGYYWSCKILNNPLETIITIGAGSCELCEFSIQIQTSTTGYAAYGVLVDGEGNALVDTDGNLLVAT